MGASLETPIYYASLFLCLYFKTPTTLFPNADYFVLKRRPLCFRTQTTLFPNADYFVSERRLLCFETQTTLFPSADCIVSKYRRLNDNCLIIRSNAERYFQTAIYTAETHERHCKQTGNDEGYRHTLYALWYGYHG